MRLLTINEVHAEMVVVLGLNPRDLDLTSSEALAGALRRAAGFLCPAPPSTLIRAVTRPLAGLIEGTDGVREQVEDTLEALVAHGDLLELARADVEDTETANTLIYPAPPSFVRRPSGTIILLGVIPDHVSPLPEELEQRIEYKNHLRLLRDDAGDDLASYLRELGLVELSQEIWLREPARLTAAEHLDELGRMLEAAPRSGEIPGLILLDPERSVRYYKGRWVEPNNQTGRFVSRRAQAYGADLWCYVDIHEGRPQRLLDLPFGQSKVRGCDEAWRLQAAIDAVRGKPQRFRLRQGPEGTREFDFFSPVPIWARRRWNCFGEPVQSTGCLYSYRFSTKEAEEEMRFVQQSLWLAEL